MDMRAGELGIGEFADCESGSRDCVLLVWTEILVGVWIRIHRPRHGRCARSVRSMYMYIHVSASFFTTTLPTYLPAWLPAYGFEGENGRHCSFLPTATTTIDSINTFNVQTFKWGKWENGENGTHRSFLPLSLSTLSTLPPLSMFKRSNGKVGKMRHIIHYDCQHFEWENGRHRSFLPLPTRSDGEMRGSIHYDCHYQHYHHFQMFRWGKTRRIVHSYHYHYHYQTPTVSTHSNVQMGENATMSTNQSERALAAHQKLEILHGKSETGGDWPGRADTGREKD